MPRRLLLTVLLLRCTLAAPSRSEVSPAIGRLLGQQTCMQLTYESSAVTLSLLSCQQVLDGLLDDTSRALDIYSALRDPVKNCVRLYVEFFPTHPNDRKEDEPEIWAHEVLKSCIFSNHRNFSQTTEVEASKVKCWPLLA